MGNNNLVGFLPGEIGNLTSMIYLDLDNNQLSGSIPAELENLEALYFIDLSYNQISGAIPLELGNLTSLVWLFFNNNQITGTIPSEFGNLEHVHFMILNDNQITGTIPLEFGNLLTLDTLNISNNQLSGNIPSQLCQAGSLLCLELSENQLTGSIPSEIGLLTYLERLDLSTNLLTGSIPPELGNLENLTRLVLRKNQLTGVIPTELGNLNNLTFLYLGYNSLSGDIPTELGNLSNLRYLSLSINQLTGSIPLELGNLNNLTSLYLGYNSLSDDIPSELGNLYNLSRFQLSNNQLTGSIPTELGILSKLEHLYLNDNKFAGSIPSEISEISSLKSLFVFNNKLENIPASFISMELDTLNFTNNLFTFEDIFNLPENAVYVPQKAIPIADIFYLSPEEEMDYEIGFDIGFPNNTYDWYKNGELFQSSETGNITLINDDPSLVHYYYLKIYNPDYSDLTILTDSLAVSIEIDIDFSYSLNGCSQAAIFTDLSSSSFGEIISWYWDFDDPESGNSNTSDEQNPTHQFISNQSSFNISLTVTDTQGNTLTDVKSILPYPLAQINGNVSTSESTIITKGYVKAYLQSEGNTGELIDSVRIQYDGSYTMENISSCVDYVIKAFPDQEIYPTVIPRYHYDAFYWNNANTVTINWEDTLVENIDINLFEYTPLSNGNSSIEGGVYYRDTKGEPVQNVDVVLEYDDPLEKVMVVSGYLPTNELGLWSFNNLPEGTYRILVDIPGLGMDSVYTVEITEPDTEITDLNYYVDSENGIYIDITGIDNIDYSSFGSISIFPNPSTGNLYIDIVKASHINQLDIQSVELYNMNGQIVKNFNIKYKGERLNTSLQLDNIDEGIYFIKVNNKDAFAIKKLIIIR